MKKGFFYFFIFVGMYLFPTLSEVIEWLTGISPLVSLLIICITVATIVFVRKRKMSMGF